MKFACKIIYWFALTFILLTITVWLAIKLLALEFQESGYEGYFVVIGFLGIGVAIMLTTTKAILKGENRRGILNSFLNRFLLAVFYFVIGIIYFASTWADGWCTWSTGAVLFEKKSNPSIKLVKRDFGCGAVDNTALTEKAFIQTSVTPFFFYYKPADTTKIDMRVWQKCTHN